MALFEDLKVWQLSQELTVEIYRLLHQNNDYGFKDQIQRASVSIMNNIAEGSESGSNALYLKFLKIAKGSCAEVRSMLYLSEKLGYCSSEEAMSLIEKTLFISRSLNRLILFYQQKSE
ncbi:MAG: four helix bundle protein [Bacteroidales bacterium]|nr:four helix bundle protein [Bacteroidales bacterium]